MDLAVLLLGIVSPFCADRRADRLLRWRWPPSSAHCGPTFPLEPRSCSNWLGRHRTRSRCSTIPFFVLAGGDHGRGRHGAAAGGLCRRSSSASPASAAGLSQVNILATTIMSGISGSSVADTAAIGSVMIPQMNPRTATRASSQPTSRLSASLQAAARSRPSHNAVIYSLATGGVGLDCRACSWPRDSPGTAARPLAHAVVLLLSPTATSIPKGESGPDPPGRENARRGDSGESSPSGNRARWHPHRRLHADRGRPPSPASGRSSSRCSSTATTNGRSCTA
jgi:hypothetical protein